MRRGSGFGDPFEKPVLSDRTDRSPAGSEDADHRLYLDYEVVDEALYSFPQCKREFEKYGWLKTDWLITIVSGISRMNVARPGGSGKFIKISSILEFFAKAKEDIEQVKKNEKVKREAAKHGYQTIGGRALDASPFREVSLAKVESFERHVREKLGI